VREKERIRARPIDAQFFYAFIGVGMVWQFVFLSSPQIPLASGR
jgi:hypothetical protein